jgi:PAS domain S-box-containing protein
MTTSIDAPSASERITVIESWHPAAEKLYGYSAEETRGRPIELLDAPGGERFREHLTAAASGLMSRFEAVHVGRDGRRVEVELTFAPIRDRAGAVTGAWCAVRDVTERKQHERELQRLAQAAEYGTDAVLSIDLGGRVRHWNLGAEKLYGYSAQEAIGRELRDLTLLDSVDEHIERVRGGASPYQYEAQRRRKDGTVIDILTNVVPWRVDGRLVGVTGVTIDITERKRAEQTAARLAAIVESTDDAIVTYSPEGVIETWNAGAERLSGYSAREAIGQPRGMAAAEGPKREPFEQARAGRTARYESRVRRRDGVIIDIAVTMSPIRGAEGAIVGVSCIWQDISERKQIERRLRESQSRLQSILDHAPALIYMMDVDGRFVVINDELERVDGVPREQALGRVRAQVLPAYAAAQHRANDLEVLREGKAITFEETTPQPDGEHVYRSVKFPSRDQDGRIFGLGGISSDVTDQRAAERERERALAELEEAQRLARVGSWSWDPQPEEVSWSAQMYELFGRDEALGPAIGEALLGYVHPEDRPRVKERYDVAAGPRPTFELEFRIITDQGEGRVLHAVGREDPSRPGRQRGTFQDVTEQRRAEQERTELLQATARAEEARRLNAALEQRVAARTAELERANRELETFAYSVSHDLRAPLRAVDGFSQLLRDERGDEVGEEGRHYLERIRAGAVRMGELIDAVLALSRLSRRRLVREPVDLSALANEIVGELQRAEPDRQVEVEIQDGLLVEADLALVRSILQNLLANAYKFTSHTPHPRVRFGAVDNSGVRAYFVADNGAGFDMAHAKQLFLPFHRLHQDSEFPGEGIGLATVVRAVHRHAGVVWAYGAVNQASSGAGRRIPTAVRPPT